MLKKFRDSLEARRNTKSLFWKSLVSIKDFGWRLAVLGNNFIKKRHNYREFHKQTNKILKTVPLKSNSDAQTEIHSLVCHKYLCSYILAIKSFLRFYDDVAVVVHSDGSLNEKDKKILKNHIKNIIVIEKNVENKIVSQLLKNKIKSQLYRSTFRNGKQLFDFALFSKTGKMVVFDPDVLFLSCPDELIDWIIGGKKEIRFLYVENSGAQQEISSQLRSGRDLHFCAAFFCIYKEVVDLELIEKILDNVKKLNWTTGESIYAVLIKNKLDSYDVSSFNRGKYQAYIGPNFSAPESDPVIFRHYNSSLGISDQYLVDIKKIISFLS